MLELKSEAGRTAGKLRPEVCMLAVVVNLRPLLGAPFLPARSIVAAAVFVMNVPAEAGMLKFVCSGCDGLERKVRM